MSRRRASSLIGTGAPSPARPSSASAATAYGDFVVIESTAPDRTPLQPAALGGDEDGLRPVDGAELAVDVVEVGANCARREHQVRRDLLVDLALGEEPQHVALATGQRADLDDASLADA